MGAALQGATRVFERGGDLVRSAPLGVLSWCGCVCRLHGRLHGGLSWFCRLCCHCHWCLAQGLGERIAGTVVHG